MVEAARAAHGPVDIVVANAGAAESAPVAQDRRWRIGSACIDVNLTGAFLTARAALPDLMREARAADRGRIIFIASTAALKGYRLCRGLLRGQARRRRPGARAGAELGRDGRDRQRGLPRLSPTRRCSMPPSTPSPPRPAARRTRRARARPRATTRRPPHHAGGGRADSAVAVLAGGRRRSTDRPSPSREGSMSRANVVAPRPRPPSKQRLRLWISLLRAARAIEAELRERLRVRLRRHAAAVRRHGGSGAQPRPA